MSSTVTPIKVGSPRDLLATVPTILGFAPSESVVLVVLDGSTNRVQFAARVDYDDDHPEWSPPLAARIRAQFESPAIISVVYTDGPLPVEDRAWLAPFDALGITVRDDLWVKAGRAGSFACDDPSCCPFDAPSSPMVLPDAAPPLDSRESLAASVAFTGPDVEELTAALPRPEFWTISDTVRLLATAPNPDDIPGFQRAIVTLARACEEIITRDVILASAMVDLDRTQRWSTTVIETIARRTNNPHLLIVMAALAYTWGNGALGWVLYDRAEEADQDQVVSLIPLVETTMDSGLHPDQMRTAFGATHGALRIKMGAPEVNPGA